MRKPRWTSSSFLVYSGGIVVLAAAVASFLFLADNYGDGAFVAWTLLVLGVLAAIADAFRRRDRWIASGIFAFATAVAFGVFVGSLWTWFGWLDGSTSAFRGFDLGRLSLVLLTLVFARGQLQRSRFPMLGLITATLGWFFVTDLISGGGSWTAVVTLAVGLVYLTVGSASDRPTAFWLHLVAGLLIAGSLLYWWHSEDWHWALIAVAALAYARIAALTARSSWAVLAALGLFAPATHFALEWMRGRVLFFGEQAGPPRVWVPLVVYAVTGFLIVALGLLVRRRAVAPVG